MKKISFFLIVWLLFLCTGSAGGFSSRNIAINRIFNKLETDAGSSIEVTVQFTNNEADKIRGFYFTDYIPAGVSVKTERVGINGTLIKDYVVEAGSAGAVYKDFIPYRWILETPPLFEENHPINPSDTLEIHYSVSSNTAGTFVFYQFNWAANLQQSSAQPQAAFGHANQSDRQTIRFIKSSIIAEDDEYTVKKGGTLILPAPGILANDTVTGENSLTAVLNTNALKGTLTLNKDGSFNYSHDGSETDSDKFTYHATDGSADSSEATVTINITTVNIPPKAHDDEGSTTINTPLTIDVCSNDTDSDGTIDPASITIITPPSHGTAQTNEDGTVKYIPNSGFTGKDTFSYTVKNNLKLVSNAAMVSISINKNSEAEKKGGGGGGGCFIYTISDNYLHPGWIIFYPNKTNPVSS